MIYFVTSRPEFYKEHDFKIHDIIMVNDVVDFKDWTLSSTHYNLDTETSVTKNGPMQHDKRMLYVVQLGTIDGEEQYVFDMIGLSEDWLEVLTAVLESEHSTFYAHNVKFEYLVLKSNLEIELNDIHDTFLMSKIVNTGYDLPTGYHSLGGCLKRFFSIELSKEAQTSFTGDPLSIEQIEYAAGDVVFVYDLFEKLKKLLEKWELWYLYNEVERHVLKVFADMELTPMGFDAKYWKKLAKDFIIEASDMKQELNDIVMADKNLLIHLRNSNKVIGVDLIQLKDEYKFNWASTVFKKKVFEVLAPSLPEEIKTKPKIKKYLKETINIPLEERVNLDLYMTRAYEKLNEKLISEHQRFLVKETLFVKKNTLLINWASSVHKLYIFQYYYPLLQDTNATSLVRITTNKLIVKFKKWVKANKNVTSYGEGFLIKYVRPDGMIAPFNLNQILNTGRISFGILLQMPAEAKFRNAFLPPQEDWVFLDTDYSSMEVLIAARAANEFNFLQAVKKNLDLHSMSASLMFKDKWKNIAESDCEQIKSGKRCTCIEHQKLRDFSKTITFGLFYGIGPVGLADRLGISRHEASDMINKFFTAFPKFATFFASNGAYAVANNHIKGLPPTSRIRFFHYPDKPGDISSIERAGKNFPKNSLILFNYNNRERVLIMGNKNHVNSGNIQRWTIPSQAS